MDSGFASDRGAFNPQSASTGLFRSDSVTSADDDDDPLAELPVVDDDTREHEASKVELSATLAADATDSMECGNGDGDNEMFMSTQKQFMST